MPNYRFGKHPPKKDYRTLRFRSYVTAALPEPPPTYDVLSKVYQNLGTSDPAALFPMDGNDQWGDCTMAAVAHAITTFRGLIGPNQVVMKERDVVKTYLHLSGGVDSGLNELDVLNYWQSNSIQKDKILAFVSVDPKNHTHIQQAIQLFGGAYIGFQVQADCQQDFNAGKPWTPGPLTPDGHAVFVTGYDQQGVTVLTWGNTQKATWDWWDECVDEAYTILPMEAANPRFAPGFNLDQLKTDLNAVAS